jgi:N-acetylneuraminic acid mutarotase
MTCVTRLVLGNSAFVSMLLLSGVPAYAAESLGTWSVAAQGTTNRTEVGAVDFKGKIYVAGGEAMGRQDSPMFEEFDPQTNRWRDLAPMPKGASHVGITALNGKIYVGGGFTANVHKNPLDQFVEYDIATNTWRNLAPLPSALGSVSLVTFKSKIHAIGGRGPDGNTVATHEIYDPATGKWTMAAALPIARDHLAAVVANDGIHVFAGRTIATVNNVGLHDVYDPATDKWLALASMPTPRSSGAAVYYRGLILYYGGECRDAKARIAFDEFDAYDPKTDSWKALAKAPSALHAQGAAVVGNTAYFVAGSSSCGSDKPSKPVYAFRMP